MNNVDHKSPELEALFDEFVKYEKAADSKGMEEVRGQCPPLLSSLLDVRSEILSATRQLRDVEDRRKRERVRALTNKIRESAPMLAVSLLSLTESF